MVIGKKIEGDNKTFLKKCFFFNLDLIKEKEKFGVFLARQKCLYTLNMNCLDENAMCQISKFLMLAEKAAESSEEVELFCGTNQGSV